MDTPVDCPYLRFLRYRVSKILPLLMPDIAIYFGYPEIQQGFSFSYDVERFNGPSSKAVITPWILICSAIVGLLGSSLIESTNEVI
jgi:hypothetical protein